MTPETRWRLERGIAAGMVPRSVEVVPLLPDAGAPRFPGRPAPIETAAQDEWVIAAVLMREISRSGQAKIDIQVKQHAWMALHRWICFHEEPPPIDALLGALGVPEMGPAEETWRRWLDDEAYTTYFVTECGARFELQTEDALESSKGAVAYSAVLDERTLLLSTPYDRDAWQISQGGTVLADDIRNFEQAVTLARRLLKG